MSVEDKLEVEVQGQRGCACEIVLANALKLSQQVLYERICFLKTLPISGVLLLFGICQSDR